MLLHCPCCHAQFSAELLTQDEAARELLGMRGAIPPSLLSYLTLFRSEKRALSWERSLKLAKEALALSADRGKLEVAMAQTVESMRAKREQGEAKPLKNHNYLKRVLESTPPSVPGDALTSMSSSNPVPRSKTASAISALENYKRS